MANKKISGYTEVTTYDDTSFYLLENSSGYYRKQSSSRLTRVITSSVTYTIGTGGDFANFILAMDFLKNKWISTGLKITLKLISDLTLSTHSSYMWSTFPFGMYAILYMEHPCSSQITVDLAGYSITVGDGAETCHGFVTAPGKTIHLTSTAPGSVIKSAKNGYGIGIYAFSQGTFRNFSSEVITIGGSGFGFEVGVQADLTGYLMAGKLNSYYNNYGFYSTHGSYLFAISVSVANNTAGGFYAAHGAFIVRIGCTGAQATNCSPAIDTVGNYNSFIH